MLHKLTCLLAGTDAATDALTAGCFVMHTTNAPSGRQADTNLLVQHEVMLDQLHPIEQLLEAAGREVATHRAICNQARRTGLVRDEQIAAAEAAADGIDEFLRHFAALEAEFLGHSTVAQEELKSMQRTLRGLSSAMDAVLSRLKDLR